MSNKKQDKTKIIQIWGDILDEGFTSVPNILLRYRKNLKIKPKHLTLIIDIMSFKWDSETPFPSYTTLANRAGMDERSIKRTMQELEELDLLIRTPRFDEDSGAQITTLFDFRPLVNKLITEKDKTDIGGVTEMSPKEDSYINNKNISINPKEKNSSMTELSGGLAENNNKENILRVHKDIRNSIFRNRIFETYDNLKEHVDIKDLVGEGALKAVKEIIINRTDYVNNKQIDANNISNRVKNLFPYNELPSEDSNARKFYVAKICDITTKEVINDLTKS